jgi:REP element-mobilizing transposase RayT
MKFDSEKHHRRSTRLKGYDYSSSGHYFITICVREKECMLGDIENKRMNLNEFGEVVKKVWTRSFNIRREIKCDTYVIMPNHIHAIVVIDQFVGANGGLPYNNRTGKKIRVNCHSSLHMKPRSLSSFVSGFKSSISRKLRFSIWKRNYFDHIIKYKKERNNIRQYIKNNPADWEKDEYNPANFIG